MMNQDCAPVVAELLGYWPSGWSTPVLFGWRHSDPHAVTVEFTQVNVTWVLDRELLNEGLSAPVGIGDVHIAPANNYGWIEIGLFSPDAATQFELPGPDVADFLHATTDVIPIGEELLWTSIDDAIEKLLSQDAGGLS
jgi:hypothetical protein